MAAIAFLGDYMVVSSVDVADIDHNINYAGNNPVEFEGVMKYEGMKIIVDIAAAGTDFCFAIALGNLPADKWRYLDGTTADVTPS